MIMIFIFALVGFLASLGAHIATFVPGVQLSMLTGFCLFFPTLIVGAAEDAAGGAGGSGGKCKWQV